MKRIRSLTIMLLVLAVVAACAAPATTPQVVEPVTVKETVVVEKTVEVVVTPTTAPKIPPKFLFVSPQVGQEGWGTVLAAAEEALPLFNATMDVAGSPNQDVAVMISALEAGLAKGYDGVWTHCIVPESFTPIINKYADAGIPVVCVADDAPFSKRLTFIGSVEFAAGQEIGKFVVKATGGEAKVGILTGLLGQPSLETRIAGIKDAFKDEPGIEIVDLQSDEADLAKGIAATKAMLLAHPEITVLMGTEGWAPQSIGLALNEAGVEPGKILATGWDVESKTIGFIQDGTITATVMQRYLFWGYGAVVALGRAYEGKTVPASINSGVAILTKDNVADMPALTHDWDTLLSFFK